MFQPSFKSVNICKNISQMQLRYTDDWLCDLILAALYCLLAYLMIDRSIDNLRLKRGFQPTQRTQRKERNEMTPLSDRPITAASDDSVCHWHAARLWQTRAKLLKLNLICIMYLYRPDTSRPCNCFAMLRRVRNCRCYYYYYYKLHNN